MQPVELNDLIPDLRARQVRVWRDVADVDPCVVNKKLAAYEHWMAMPLQTNFNYSPVMSLPRYLRLDLSRHVQRNVSCFRLRAHRLAVESAHWSGTEHSVCSCGCAERQDEKHVLLACRFPQVCTLRQNFSDLFGGFQALSPANGSSYADSSRAVPDYFIYQFMNQCNNRLCYFVSELMDFYDFSQVPSSQPV